MTYAELTAQIENYLQELGTQFVADIPNFIKTAENKILHEIDIPVFTKNATTAFTAASPYLQLPTDYLSAREVAVIVSSSYNYLLQKDVSFIREAYPTVAATGTPRYYAQFDNNTLIVGPTPLSNYTVELHYFAAPESIVTSTTSWLGDNAPALLLYGSLVEAYIYNKGDADLLAVYKTEYKEALQRVKLLGAGKTKTDNYRTPNQQTAGP